MKQVLWGLGCELCFRLHNCKVEATVWAEKAKRGSFMWELQKLNT